MKLLKLVLISTFFITVNIYSMEQTNMNNWQLLPQEIKELIIKYFLSRATRQDINNFLLSNKENQALLCTGLSNIKTSSFHWSLFNKNINFMKLDNQIEVSCLDKNKGLLFTGNKKGDLQVWDLENNSLKLEQNVFESGTKYIEINSDSNLLLLVSKKNLIKIMAIRDVKHKVGQEKFYNIKIDLISNIRSYNNSNIDFISLNNNFVAIKNSHNELKVWDINKKTDILNKQDVNSFKLSNISKDQDKDFIYILYNDKNLEKFDLAENRTINTINNSSSFDISSDQNLLIVNRAKMIYIHDNNRDSRIGQFQQTYCINQDNSLLADTRPESGSVSIWDIKNKMLIKTIEPVGLSAFLDIGLIPIYLKFLNPNQLSVIYKSILNHLVIFIWDINSKEPISELWPNSNQKYFLAKNFYITHDNNNILVHNMSGEVELAISNSRFCDISEVNNKTFLSSISNKGKIRIWDLDELLCIYNKEDFTDINEIKILYMSNNKLNLLIEYKETSNTDSKIAILTIDSPLKKISQGKKIALNLVRPAKQSKCSLM